MMKKRSQASVYPLAVVLAPGRVASGWPPPLVRSLTFRIGRPVQGVMIWLTSGPATAEPQRHFCRVVRGLGSAAESSRMAWTAAGRSSAGQVRRASCRLTRSCRPLDSVVPIGASLALPWRSAGRVVPAHERFD